MTLPASGAMSISAVDTELGRAATATISLNDTNVRTLSAKSTGAISFSDFYNKSNGVGSIALLLVAGGGGTGNGIAIYGGGGGAGEYFYSPSYTVTTGSTYTVTVGAGGLHNGLAVSGKGGNSTFGSLSANGGGYGGGATTSGAPTSGGSGGSGGGGGGSGAAIGTLALQPQGVLVTLVQKVLQIQPGVMVLVVGVLRVLAGKDITMSELTDQELQILFLARQLYMLQVDMQMFLAILLLLQIQEMVVHRTSEGMVQLVLLLLLMLIHYLLLQQLAELHIQILAEIIFINLQLVEQ
jgi:hypothetical protein